MQSLSQFLTPSTMSAKADRRELVARTKHDLKELEAMGELRIIIEGREWRLLPPIPPKRDAGRDSDATWDKQ